MLNKKQEFENVRMQGMQANLDLLNTRTLASTCLQESIEKIQTIKHLPNAWMQALEMIEAKRLKYAIVTPIPMYQTRLDAKASRRFKTKVKSVMQSKDQFFIATKNGLGKGLMQGSKLYKVARGGRKVAGGLLSTTMLVGGIVVDTLLDSDATRLLYYQKHMNQAILKISKLNQVTIQRLHALNQIQHDCCMLYNMDLACMNEDEVRMVQEWIDAMEKLANVLNRGVRFDA